MKSIFRITEKELRELPGADFGEIGEEIIYFPWNNTLLRCVSREHLFILRTARNKLLINESEQTKLAEAVIGVAGMSVGAGIAIGAVYSGMSNRIKIADNDTLETSNLNRLRESLLNVGQPKARLAAQQIYEINPFSEVDLYEEGLNEANIATFFNNPKLAVVVDEIDDFKMKVRLRIELKDRNTIINVHKPWRQHPN